jgi:hypothetical protein
MSSLEGVTAGGAASAAMAQNQAYVKQEAQVTMFKKALDAQTEGVLTLLEGVAPVPSSSLPMNLGQNINTTA